MFKAKRRGESGLREKKRHLEGDSLKTEKDIGSQQKGLPWQPNRKKTAKQKNQASSAEEIR